MRDLAENNDETGFEIALAVTPNSDIVNGNCNGDDLENRYVVTGACSSSTLPNDSSDHWESEEDNSTGDLMERQQDEPKHDMENSQRSRFRRRMVVGLLVVFVIAILATSLAATNNQENRQQTTASSLEVNPASTTTTPAPTPVPDNTEVDTPSAAPKVSASPTESPVVLQTASPTTSPTVAVTIVRSIKSRYAYDETITINFSIVDVEMQTEDWIGIYPADADSSNLQSALAFMFLCNKQTLCDTPVSAGQVTFGSSVAEEARLAAWTWPLDPGTYKAYVLRGFQGPFQVLAEASSFEILQDLFVHTVVPTVRQIRRDIRNLILDDEFMGPKFVRLGFHDCTGGCDGCVDMTFADNAGLEVPIEALQPIVDQYENPLFNISRADIWALAALVGADVAQERSETKVNFALEFIGRKNCEDIFTQCFDQDGNERECSATLGPHVHLPEPDITTEELFHFFNSEFGFSVQETVALMGAHTLGVLSRTNSGFNGTNGWVRDNLLLDNDYYHELVGGEEGDDIDTLIELAPPWLRFEIDNSDLPRIPDRRVWRAFPPAFDGSGLVEIMMLNADVSCASLSIHICPSPLKTTSHAILLLLIVTTDRSRSRTHRGQHG